MRHYKKNSVDLSAKGNSKVVQIAEDSIESGVYLLITLLLAVSFSAKNSADTHLISVFLFLYPVIFVMWIESLFGNKGGNYWHTLALAVVPTYGLIVGALSFSDNFYMNTVMCISLLMLGFHTVNYFNKNYDKKEFVSMQLLKNEDRDVRIINDYYRYILRMYFTSVIMMDCYLYYEIINNNIDEILFIVLPYLASWVVVLMFMKSIAKTNIIQLTIMLYCIAIAIGFLLKNGISTVGSLVIIVFLFFSIHFYVEAESRRKAFKTQ